ncbi:hypothetical protein AGMMS49975_27820 [Clostridia bacterium]|nr:hypothetical protein AGMMS49975_27820 [Clostridia bacterium]
MNALLEYELEEIEDDEQERDTKFRVTDLNSANWVFRKLNVIQRKVEENKRLAAEEKQRIDDWLNKQNRKAESDIAYFNMLILDYFGEQYAQDPKFRLSTPYGKVSVTRRPDWNYGDADIVFRAPLNA